MATTKTENSFEDVETLETFRNLFVRIGSGKAADLETATRKAVLMAAKYGLEFHDAIRVAFGQGDRTAELEAENATLREELEQTKQGGDELADALGQAKQTIAALENRQTQDRGEGHAGFKAELKACFRHIWSFAQFRLLVLTLMIEVAIVAPMGGLSLLLGAVPLLIAWGVAQCRKQSFGQTFMKSLVYFSVIAVGGMVIDAVHGDLNSPVGLIVLLLAMLLTLSRLNEWLCEQVRMRIWESHGVRAARGWF